MLPKLENFEFKEGFRYFFFSQRLTLIKNYYDIFEVKDGNLEGEKIAYAEQKAFKLKEEIVFFKDDSKQESFFSLKARNILDIASVIDVFGDDSHKVGVFKKEFGTSLLKTTWVIVDPDQESKTVLKFEERSMVLALVRRILDFVPVVEMFAEFIRTNFDIKKGSDSVGLYTRGFRIKDTYLMEIREDLVDEVGIETLLAQGVALDTLQNR